MRVYDRLISTRNLPILEIRTVFSSGEALISYRISDLKQNCEIATLKKALRKVNSALSRFTRAWVDLDLHKNLNNTKQTK